MDLSPEQIERSQRTIKAAAVFADNAPVIVTEVSELPDDHVLVAVVTADYYFAGTHHVARTELVERVPALEEDGWAMVFSPGADTDHVAARTTEMISLAGQADRDDPPDQRPPRSQPANRTPDQRPKSRDDRPQRRSVGSGPIGGFRPCCRSRRSRSSSP